MLTRIEIAQLLKRERMKVDMTLSDVYANGSASVREVIDNRLKVWADVLVAEMLGAETKYCVVIDHLVTDKVINAIKTLREVDHGLGLKEAKDLAEMLRASLTPVSPAINMYETDDANVANTVCGILLTAGFRARVTHV